MTTDREALLQVMARRAGFTETQVDALRRRDYAALLLDGPAAPPDPPTADTRDFLDRRTSDARPTPGPGPSRTELQAALERVSGHLATVRRQRDAGLQLLRQLATRLGCCPDCWGTEPACPRCGGLGSPGFSAPDPRLLDWLGPALDRIPVPDDRPLPHATASPEPPVAQPGSAPSHGAPESTSPTAAGPSPGPRTADTDGWA